MVIPIKAAWKALEKSSEGKRIKNKKERMAFGYEVNFCTYEDGENAASRASDGSSSHSVNRQEARKGPGQEGPFQGSFCPAWELRQEV